jgi:DNA (cytosine-5)-methyltransferase 1
MLTSRGLGRVLGDLASLGFDAEWCVLGAVDTGAPIQRERIWILGSSNLFRQVRDNKHQDEPQCWWSKPGRVTWWDTPSEYPLLADGMAHELDALRASGNGQVPAVVALAWETLYRRLMGEPYE